MSAQVDTLEAAGATKIYREKISGVRADRPQLVKSCFPPQAASDVVLVTKLIGLVVRPVSFSHLIDRIGKGPRRIPLTRRPAVGHFKPAGSAALGRSWPPSRSLSASSSVSALARAVGGRRRMASNLAANPSSRPISGLRPSSGGLQAKPWHRSRGATRSISRPFRGRDGTDQCAMTAQRPWDDSLGEQISCCKHFSWPSAKRALYGPLNATDRLHNGQRP